MSYREKINHAKKQLCTALNAFSRKTRVTFINGVGIQDEIDWKEVKRIIGIVTLNIKDVSYNDPEYRLSLSLRVDELRNHEVHYFILRDLFNMVSDLSTPRDFIEYLSDRKKAKCSQRVWAGNELDFLALLKTKYNEWEKFKNGVSKFDSIGIFPGLWEEFSENKQANESRLINFRDSRLFDYIVRELNTTIQYSIEQGTTNKETATRNYSMIVALLSKLRRIERRDFARKAYSKIESTIEYDWRYFVSIYPEIDLAILFLACNETDRQIKRNLMYNLCIAASKIVNTTNILGIAIEGKKVKGHSIDFMLSKVEDLKGVEIPGVDKIFSVMKVTKSEEWEIESNRD